MALRKRTFVANNAKVLKNKGIWRWNLSKKMGLEISRRGIQFLAPESLCSPSYEGLKVHASHSTINVFYKLKDVYKLKYFINYIIL